jgi:hypothetical protein
VSPAQIRLSPTPSSDEPRPNPGLLRYLRTLPAGSVVVQLDDGTIDVCDNLDAAEARFAAASSRPSARGWQRIAAAVNRESDSYWLNTRLNSPGGGDQASKYRQNS